MNDLVSVIVPIYNTSIKFKKCFESILMQKYYSIEVILIDDGSSDTSAQTCDIIALSANTFPVFVIHKANGGVSSARNLGIDFANGNYIVFVDSDDIVTPDYVSEFMSAKEKYSDVGHIWCGMEWTVNQKQYIFSETDSFSIVSRDNYFDLAEKLLTQSPCTRLYDVSILRNNGIRMIKDLSLGEDLIFNLDYLDVVPSKKICVINAANYVYLDYNEDSLKNKYREDLESINAFILDRELEYMIKWGLVDSESMAKYYKNVYYRSVQNMNNTFHKKNKIPYYRKIIRNNQILKSNEFRKALQYMNTKIPKHLMKVYKTRNYFFVRIYDKLVNIYGQIKE